MYFQALKSDHLQRMRDYSATHNVVYVAQSAAIAWGIQTWNIPDKLQIRSKGGAGSSEVSTFRAKHLLNAPVAYAPSGLRTVTIEYIVLSCIERLTPIEGLIVADSALHLRLIDYELLYTTLTRTSSPKGRAKARKIAEIMDGSRESAGESLTYAALLDLGVYACSQYLIGPYRVDFAIIDYKIVIEFDGAIKYDGRYGSEEYILDQQLKRQEYIESLGWRFIRLSWDDVRHTLSKLETALKAYDIPMKPSGEYLILRQHMGYEGFKSFTQR